MSILNQNTKANSENIVNAIIEKLDKIEDKDIKVDNLIIK